MVSPECTQLVTLCRNGDLELLLSALQEPSTSQIALKTEGELMNEMTGTTWNRLNLTRMIEAAALSGHVEVVEALLHFGQQHEVSMPKMVNKDTTEAALRSEKPLELLLKFRTVDPHVFSRPLHLGGEILSYACGAGIYSRPNIEIVQYLMEAGFHPDGRGGPRIDHEPNHLAWATWLHSPEMVETLLAHGATIGGSNAMRTAAFHGRIEMLELLVKYGGDVNEVAKQGSLGEVQGTPLHVAAAAGKEDAAMWLLEHGADVTVKDAEGKTAKEALEESGILRPFNSL